MLEKEYQTPRPDIDGSFYLTFWLFGEGYKEEGKYDRLCFKDMKPPINCIEKDRVFSVQTGRKGNLLFTVIEEVWCQLLKGFLIRFRPGDGLIQRQMNFIGRIDCASADFCHRIAKGLEVVIFGLIDQDIAVRQKQNAFFTFRFPSAPDNLKGGIGFTGAGRHHQQNTIFTRRHCFYRAVNRLQLIVTR